MVTKQNQPCERSYFQNNLTEIISFTGNHVVQRAKHGIAGTTGNGLAYSPAKGYVGPDDFKVAVDFANRAGPGKFFIHFNVTVE
jgi:hypothetical protein